MWRRRRLPPCACRSETPHTPRVLGLPFWHPGALLATWFGVGLAPVAPGSLASIVALPMAWAIRGLWGEPGLAIAAAIVFAAGCWAAAMAVAASGRDDPGAVVIDEVAGQLLALLAAAPSLLGWVSAFLLFRLFDIWKPWPVRWADRHVAGGLGIMLDDLLAAGYVALILFGLAALGGAVGVRS